MKNLSSTLDRVANDLESLGYRKLAMELDLVANSMDRQAALGPKLQKIVEFVKKNEAVAKIMRDAIKNLPLVIANGIATIKKSPRTASLLMVAVKIIYKGLGSMSRTASMHKEASVLSMLGTLAPFAVLVAFAAFLEHIDLDLDLNQVLDVLDEKIPILRNALQPVWAALFSGITLERYTPKAKRAPRSSPTQADPAI